MTVDMQQPFGTYGRHALKRLVWAICDAPVFSARLRRRLRKHIARKLKGPFDVTFAGIKWRLYPEENYCDRVIFARKRMPEKAEHDRLAARITPKMTFVDIGANIGSYSLYVAQKSANTASIIALEPHPRTFQKLQYNLEINDVHNAVALQLASGPVRTSMQLWSDGGSNIGHTSLLQEGTSNAKVAVNVDVVPLVEILDEQKVAKIDLLKIDIEGFEDQVLMPFFNKAAIELWPRLVLIETAHHSIWQHDVVGWMKNAGYNIAFETAENLLLELK